MVSQQYVFEGMVLFKDDTRPKLLEVKPVKTTVVQSDLNQGDALEEASPDDVTREDASLDDLEPHSDENQIKLDTNRSFVMYPVGQFPLVDVSSATYLS